MLVHPPAKNQSQREEQLANIACRLCRLDAGNDHVGECRCEKKEGPDEKKHQATPFIHLVFGNSVSIKADRVIPSEEGYNRHQGVPRQFNSYVCEHEDPP